jgi:hypothetical protein
MLLSSDVVGWTVGTFDVKGQLRATVGREYGISLMRLSVRLPGTEVRHLAGTTQKDLPPPKT